MKSINKYSIINFLVCIILVIVCKYAIHPYLATFKEDDIFSVISEFWPDHGEYLTSFLASFTIWWLPEMLHIHPQNIVDPWGVLLRCIILVWGCFVMASFVSPKNQNKIYMPFFILLSFYLTLASFNYEYRVFYIYAGFFRFYFPLALNMLFWLMVYKNSSENSNNTKFNFMIFILTAFLAGFSSEFISLFSLIPLSVIGIVKIFRKQLKFSDKNTIGAFAFIFGSITVMVQAYLFSYSFTYFQNPQADLKLFLDEYWNLVVIQHIMPVFVIAVLIFILKILNKINKNTLITVLSFTAAPFIVMGSLWFGGLYDHDFSHTWLFHGHFHQTIDNIYFCIQFFLFGLILQDLNFAETDKNSVVKKCISMLLITIFIQIIYSFNSFYAYCRDGRNHHKYNDKMNTYITDKMFLFYILKNQPIVLGNKFLHNVVGVVNPDVYREDITETEVKNSRWFNYIGFIYPKVVDTSKYDQNNKIYFISEEDAMEEFKKAGGNFEEGEIEKADFNRLYDKKFVLNEK